MNLINTKVVPIGITNKVVTTASTATAKVTANFKSKELFNEILKDIYNKVEIEANLGKYHIRVLNLPVIYKSKLLSELRSKFSVAHCTTKEGLHLLIYYGPGKAFTKTKELSSDIKYLQDKYSPLLFIDEFSIDLTPSFYHFTSDNFKRFMKGLPNKHKSSKVGVIKEEGKWEV